MYGRTDRTMLELDWVGETGLYVNIRDTSTLFKSVSEAKECAEAHGLTDYIIKHLEIKSIPCPNDCNKCFLSPRSGYFCTYSEDEFSVVVYKKLCHGKDTVQRELEDEHIKLKYRQEKYI